MKHLKAAVSLFLSLSLALSWAPLPLIAAQSAAGPAAPAVIRGPIAFSYAPAQVTALAASAQAGFTASLDAIAAVPADQRTFANTVLALEQAGAEFGDRVKPLTFLKEVSADPAVRDAAEKANEEIDKFGVAVMNREDVFKALSAYAAKGEALGLREKKLLDDSLRGFKMAGMGLASEERARLRGMQERLNKLAQDFAANIRDHKDSLEVTLEQLEGLPQDYIDGLERTPDGKYKVGLSYPEYGPIMQYAKDGDVRRALNLKFNNRAADKNIPLLEEAVRVRRESAELLGYPNYPSMILENRMSKGPEQVMDFLNSLWLILLRQAPREVDALLAQKQKEDPAAKSLESHDLGYYGQKLRKARFDLDPEEVKQYFPVERVIEGTLKVYQKVLGLTFTEVPNPEVWHPDAKLYEIADAATGRRIAHFYLDLHPREGKYGHAAAFDLKVGRENADGSYNEPAAAMVANFTKAVAGKPALLKFGEVETFFHEFGHLMHATLTRAKYSSQAGFNVAWDFVEAPSQMLENFIYEREVLDEISGHYQDPSRKLPAELHLKLLSARDFNQSLGYLRQLSLAIADMMIHLGVPVKVNDLFNQFLSMIGLVPMEKGSHFAAGFGHLMGGYGAGYYSYLWSEVFALEIWSRFKKEGVMNPATGLSYRREILEKGSERSEEESLRAFLGRDPSVESFLEMLRGGDAPKPSAA